MTLIPINSFTPDIIPIKIKNNLLNYIKTDEKLLLSFSGGADSMALLIVLKLLSSISSFSFSIFYFQHSIRLKEETQAEENFVIDVAKQLSIALFMEKAAPGEIIAHAKKNKMSVEEAARFFRMEALQNCMNLNFFSRKLTAHHLDDQMELLIMNFFQGSGYSGLKGMSESDRIAIRPLLSMRKSEIIDWLEFYNIPYLTDSTNSDTRYLRNSIRHNIIPVVQELFPSMGKSLGQLSFKMQLLDEDVKKRLQTEVLWNKIEPFLYQTNHTQFQNTSLFFQVESLFTLLNNQFSDLFKKEQRIPFSQVMNLAKGLTSLKSCDRAIIFCSLAFFILDDSICVEPKIDNIPSIKFPSIKTLLRHSHRRMISFGSHKLMVEILNEKPKYKTGFWFPFSVSDNKIPFETFNCASSLEVRSWRSKDCLQVKDRCIKVKKMLSSWQIPRHRRAQVPIILIDNNIIAVLGSVWSKPDRISSELIMKKSDNHYKWFVIIAEKGC